MSKITLCAAILDPKSISFFLFRYGAQVENYLEVYLRTPGLSRSDVTRALLARGSARKQGGESLLAKADHGTDSSLHLHFIILSKIYSTTDFKTVLKLDPLNKELQRCLRRQTVRRPLINHVLAHLK